MKHFSLSAILARMCAACLALLGFGCSSDDKDPDVLCMYGTPTGDYEIKGKVSNENGDPVSGASIRATDPHDHSGEFAHIKTVTGSDGSYSMARSGDNRMIMVVCTPADRSLEPDSVVVTLDFKGDAKGWNLGHAEQTVDFTLKKKRSDK
ncbi:MAG: radical SAM-associated putative lipoprotein [Muribaculaceae bacterium]|nr:radical SAM-associated putative lipoprotein [Muribaculaceae bacterium]